MTASTIATLTTTATADQRRAALLELADLIDSEDRSSRRPLSDVLTLLVPPLASHRLTSGEAVEAFRQLVGAVADRARFTADEDVWLLDRGYRVTAESRVGADRRLSCDVDYWLDRIVGGESGV